ncbi:hypothetical protein Trydic_g10836 [Trypoxylus dichotomus]
MKLSPTDELIDPKNFFLIGGSRECPNLLRKKAKKQLEIWIKFAFRQERGRGRFLGPRSLLLHPEQLPNENHKSSSLKRHMFQKESVRQKKKYAILNMTGNLRKRINKFY